MPPGGSSTGSSRNSGQHGSGAGGVFDPFGPEPTPPGGWPSDDEPTVISPKTGSSGPMPILTGQEWAEALVGQTLGHYDLIEIVGTGGMGAVFRGHDTALNKTVAVKVLLPSSGDDEDLLRRFKNEAQSAARLDHVHAARVYYVGEERGLHYIVYEYIEGRNIRDLVVSGGPLPVDEALRYTYQISDTLAHAAARDVVHRDIKPSNILVTDDGIAKLVDMGLARLHQVEHSGGDLTASGVTLGTFDFISPEQARDPRTADTRSDIYSLGCTLYFMLAGQPPFPSGTVLQKLLQHEGDAPPDVRQLRADCPDELAGIVRTMLAKKPEHRFQTPAALMSELASFAERAGIGSLGTAVVPSAPRRRSDAGARRHVPWIVAGVTLVLLVIFIDARSRTTDRSTLFEPLPETAGSAKSTGNGADASPSREGSTPGDSRNDSPGAGNAKPPRDVRSADVPRVNGAAGANQTSVASPEPSVVADRGHPLRAELGAAARGSTRTAPVGEGAKSGGDESIAVSAAPTAERERAIADAGELAADGQVADAAGAITVAVAASADGQSTFATLEAALDAAFERLEDADPVSGDPLHGDDAVIRVVLRYDGPMASRPLRIAGANVEIAAGEGFAPGLVFRTTAAEPAGDGRGMISVADGELSIDRVAIELAVGSDATSGPVLFDVQEANLVRVRDCSLTISAAKGSSNGRASGAFFAIAPGRPAGAMAMAPDMPEMNGAMPLVTIRLDRCVVRGETGLLRVGGARNARLSWTNGLAVLGGPLLAVDASRQQLPGAHVRAMLSHVTAALRSNLVAIANAQTAPFLPLVEMESYDGIFVGGDQPLVLSQGVDSVEDFRDRFRWKGERNFYDNWPRLWRIHGVGFESEPQDMTFRDWATHWGRAESAPSLGPVIWRNPISLARPAHEQQLADFALVDTDANPARASGEKGADAGAQFEQLPPLPWPGQFSAPPPKADAVPRDAEKASAATLGADAP